MPGADGPAAAAATPGKAKRRGKAERLAEDPKIGVYTSIPWGFDTASYWIEGPEGLIVIDTQFLVSAAGEMIEAAEAITGKKVKLAIVLHPNPDKFNGTSTFQAHGVKVVTSAQVVAQIPEVHVKRTEAFFERYKPDYPAEQPRPESFGDADQELSAGGVTVKVRVMGTGCSAAHVAVEYGEHLFVGDLVGNGTHAWLEIGEAEAWIERLKELSSPPHRFVHPGRGKSGGPELLTWEEGYLQRVLAEVAKEGPVMPPPAGALDRVKGRILEAYPGLAYDVFLELGLPAVWETQALKASKGGG
ncbi:putative beta lactamase [Chondromyces apiculatus DSM 436]|uniref:Putative beta lactamase n=2 Tax=Chondromyces apiculatus TaxID=51 RepID=A0A017SWT5_9BACT|nr:putative beta lactamase [Chondromyces apiculatus DSM 436]